MPTQSNALTASTYFIACIISDALTAIDSTDHADVPASLRGTSLVLVCCFAAPVLMRPDVYVYGWFQRPIIGTTLLVVALLGVHHGGETTRTFDAIYTTIVSLAVTWLFSAGGVDEQAKKQESKDMDKAVSTSSAMLAGSLLFYSNLRLLRAGLRHSMEVRSFRLSPTGLNNATSSINLLGYAYASDSATIAVSFGGAIGVGAAITMVYHVQELASGTGTVALQLGVSAVYQSLAALAASFTYGDQVNWLPAIFGDSACKALSDACDAASTSRRFSSVNTQVPGLWLSALGLFALAYPPSARLFNASQAARWTWSIAGSIFGIVALTAAILIVIGYSDFSGPGGHTDYVMVITVVAIFWSAFFDTWVGTFAYIIAFVFEEAMYVNEYGFERLLSHLTHVTLIFCASLLILHMALTTITFFARPSWLEKVLGMVTVAGASLSIGLFCASACLMMSANGSLGDLEDTHDGTRFAMAFTYQHFIPAFIWAPLYTCRCEVQLLSRVQRLFVWFATVLLDVVVYGIVLLVLSREPPTASILNMWSLAGCVIGAGILPWAATSSV